MTSRSGRWGAWPHPPTPGRLSSAVFRAGWDDTVVLLAEEAGHLGALHPIVLQLVCDPSQVRRDGMLRARAQVDHPGVIVTLTSPGRPPLVFATDTYDQPWPHAMPAWQANTRAVALGLRALRAVDRYGITRRGQQYAGFRELEATASPDGFTSADDALRWMRKISGYPADMHTAPVAIHRAAVRVLHPDVGGDPADWARLDQARQFLETAGML